MRYLLSSLLSSIIYLFLNIKGKSYNAQSLNVYKQKTPRGWGLMLMNGESTIILLM